MFSVFVTLPATEVQALAPKTAPPGIQCRKGLNSLIFLKEINENEDPHIKETNILKHSYKTAVFLPVHCAFLLSYVICLYCKF
jgi:hypothetical protein